MSVEYLSEASCLTLAGEILDRIRIRFALSPACIDAMAHRMEGLQLCFFSPGENLWYPLCEASTGDCIGQVQSPEPAHLSHVSFQPPIAGRILRPVVCLCRYEEQERIRPALVHELIHLFSSVWQWQSPDKICLRSGIACYNYHCTSDGTAIRCTGMRDMLLNERLTDYLTCRVLDIPDTQNDRLAQQLAALSPQQIARAYFENHGEYLPLLF